MSNTFVSSRMKGPGGEALSCLPVGKTQGQEATGSRVSIKEEDPAGVQIGGHMRSWLAHVPPYGWNHAGRDGRTSTDHPRLPAPQQSSYHQQILAGDIEDEAVGAGEIGRGDFASGGIPAENNSCPMIVKGRKKRWDVRFSLVVP
jgi:hypothetical protein